MNAVDTRGEVWESETASLVADGDPIGAQRWLCTLILAFATTAPDESETAPDNADVSWADTVLAVNVSKTADQDGNRERNR